MSTALTHHQAEAVIARAQGRGPDGPVASPSSELDELVLALTALRAELTVGPMPAPSVEVSAWLAPGPRPIAAAPGPLSWWRRALRMLAGLGLGVQIALGAGAAVAGIGIAHHQGLLPGSDGQEEHRQPVDLPTRSTEPDQHHRSEDPKPATAPTTPPTTAPATGPTGGAAPATSGQHDVGAPEHEQSDEHSDHTANAPESAPESESESESESGHGTSGQDSGDDPDEGQPTTQPTIQPSEQPDESDGSVDGDGSDGPDGPDGPDTPEDVPVDG